MLLNCGVGEDSCESLELQWDPTSPFWRRSALGFLWKDWCWSWNSETLATWCEELTHWKRPWCWERLKAGGEGDDRGWDGWMASPSWWTWVWASSGSWWWTGKPGVLQSKGPQRVRHDWATELNSLVGTLHHGCTTLPHMPFYSLISAILLFTRPPFLSDAHPLSTSHNIGQNPPSNFSFLLLPPAQPIFLSPTQYPVFLHASIIILMGTDKWLFLEDAPQFQIHAQ